MSKRAELRRAAKEKEKNQVKYSLSTDQINTAVRAEFDKVMDQLKIDAVEDGLGAAMVLLMTVPFVVLRDNYWKKTYKQKLPVFADQVIDILNKWENGEVDLEKLREEIWEDAGIRVERDLVNLKKGEHYGKVIL